MTTEHGFDAIWQFDKEEDTNIRITQNIPDINTFIYNNDSLIVNLPSVSSIAGVPNDDIYRIKTKWRGNDLYMFPPFGDRWELFCTWENNRFMMYGEGKMRTFKKINPVDIPIWQQGLLKAERKMWSYPYGDPNKIDA